MSSDLSKNEQIRQKCLKCLKNLNANFYTCSIACRGMDAESCPNDGTKMHNVNFTKNDVRNVRIVRFLRFLTFLNANFHTSGKAGGDIFYICPKLPKMIQKLTDFPKWSPKGTII